VREAGGNPPGASAGARAGAAGAPEGAPSVCLGVQLASPDTALRMVDKGPSAENKAEVRMTPLTPLPLTSPVDHCTVLQRSLLCWTNLCCAVLSCPVQYSTVLYCMILCCTVV